MNRGEVNLGSLLLDPAPNPEEQYLKMESRQKFIDIVLTQCQEPDIFLALYGLSDQGPMTISATAKYFSCSVNHIRHIRQAGLRRLRRIPGLAQLLRSG